MARYIAIVARALLCTSTLAAQQPSVEPEWREPIDRAAAFIGDLTAGRIDDAWKKYQLMLPEPGTFEHFQKSVGVFPKDGESLKLIAERRYSAKSRRLYFTIDSKFGPVLVELAVFRYSGQWYFGYFGYQMLVEADANWHRLHDDVLPITRLAEPIQIALPQTAGETDKPLDWQPVIEGKIALVSVAKALFEQKEGAYFLSGIRVSNTTDGDLGVDLRSRRFCVRINQWSASDSAERGTIDESRDIPADFTADEQTSLRRAFRTGQLVRIPAGKSVEYYCPFIGEERSSNRGAIERLQTKFIILSMDGELRVTNGEQSESLRCGEPGQADITIARPVPWRKVSYGGRIVPEDQAAAADKPPVDTSVVTDVCLIPAKPSSGWRIRFLPDGSAHAQFGSALGDAAHLSKGSVDFERLLKAAFRLKSDRRLERLSTILVSFNDEPNAAFSLNDDTLFRYLIDSFDKKWKPEMGSSRFDELRRQYPIFSEEMPADGAQP